MSFDASTAGTPAQIWAADARLHDRPPLELDGVSELVVVAAHPDDETLGAGGLIAECSQRGMRVRVIVVTDGGAQGLAELRSTELREAVRLLAPAASVHELGVPDGRAREHRDHITDALRPLLADAGPGTLVAAPWRGDGHRDHRVVGEVVAELAEGFGRRLVEYPIWLWHWGDPATAPWNALQSLSIDAALKAAALAEFGSQLQGEHPVLRADFMQNFARDELFIVQQPRLGADYFVSLYARHDDPWGFGTRWYEARKRAITVAALPDERYARAFEIGCSLGYLTELLAARCDELLAVDISPAAVERAAARMGDRARVEVRDVLADHPAGPFDLVVLSEVGYYFSLSDLTVLIDSIEASLAPGGTVLACHWRHPVADYPLGGDEVHAALGSRSWSRLVMHTEADFVVEVFSRDERSVAQRAGLV